MGLDAFVFCDCYEKGHLKHPPPHPELILLRPNGDLGCRNRDPKVLDEFDAWRASACRHECGMIAGEVLGNFCHVEALCDALLVQRRDFTVLINKVLYCGSHTGDCLTLRNVKKLTAELERLKSFRTGDKTLDKDLQFLRRQLQTLARVALKLEKPIAF